MPILSIVFAVLALFGTTRSARAQQPACAELGGNIVYGIGGSAHTPLVGQIASRVREPDDPAHQLTIVYAEPGPCYGFDLDAPISETPIGTTARYWDAGSTAGGSCVLDAEVVPDFSVTPHVASLCLEPTGLAEGTGAFEGPVSTFNVIVPFASTQESISAEALYFVLKFGDAAQVDPWNDERYFIHGGATSAVTRSIAAAVGITEAIEHGYDHVGGASNLQIVAQSGVRGGSDPVEEPNAELTLGFASGENAESNRTEVRTLAFQHFDQACGYYPDSSATALDKLNVRTGRYALWSPIYFHARVDTEGAIEDEHVARLIGYATSALEPPPELPILDIAIDSYHVPQCAMQVRRDAEGVLSSYQHDVPCGCYFEARATGRSSCTPCDDDGDCASDAACHYGYCEP